MDINPANPGHTLVIPKKHVRDIYELDGEVAAAVMRTAEQGEWRRGLKEWPEGEMLKKIRRFLEERSVKAYPVGGYVRDVLLGRPSHDIDFVVDGDAVQLARQVADGLGGSFVLLDRELGTGRVVLRDEKGQRFFIDFARLRGGSLEADLAQRDFTVSAMAVDITDEGPCLVDPHGGEQDLRQGWVRAISETIFRDDPLRLLRAVRLVAELGFSIDPLTDALLRRDHPLIVDVSSERVRDELTRLLAFPRAADSLAYLDSSGLLTTIIPELAALKGMEQPPPHRYDGFQHSVETVRKLEWVLAALGMGRGGEQLLAYFSPWLLSHLRGEVVVERPRYALLKLVALLHDVGKPLVRTMEKDGRIRFLDHEKRGATLAGSILKRLRFGTREVQLARSVVRNHMRPLLLAKRASVTKRAIYRFFRHTGEAGVDTLLLSLADHRATMGPDLEVKEWERLLDLVCLMLVKYYEEREEAVSPPKLIDGHDLMERFGLEPGPRIGELLEAVREAQVQREVATREEALSFVEKLLDEPLLRKRLLRQPPDEGHAS